MSRVGLSLLFVLLTCFSMPVEAMAFRAKTDVVAEDPEIDRSPIWARMYAQYLFFLGREMFWPNLEERETFRLAVVNWPDLAEELASFLEGRSIAGMPVELVPLTDSDLSSDKSDFTVLFIGGTGLDAERESVGSALTKWNRKGNRNALVITDARSVPGHDLIFQRLKEGEDLRLCVKADLNSLQTKGLELPSAFAQRQCP